MAILRSLRKSRAVTFVVLLGAFGFVATAGAFGACGNKDAPAASAAAAAADSTQPARTPTYSVEIVNTFPHDRGAFTEGLFFHQGRLFESTGEVGTSNIREVELATGRVLRKLDIGDPYFGEGTIIVDDKLYQLTWKNGKAFIYDWKTFAPKGEFTYEGEGWALTTDGKSLIMSNGSSVIAWRDPKTFKIEKTLEVNEHGTPVKALNELEWIKGELWANVWQSDQIARIDPNTGNVIGWVDLAGILPAIDRDGNEDVLNGIAYDAAKDRIFVTGKKWSKMFEIKLKRRS